MRLEVDLMQFHLVLTFHTYPPNVQLHMYNDTKEQIISAAS